MGKLGRDKTDWERQLDRENAANYRARKAGLPEPYPRQSQEEKKERKERNTQNLEWAQAQDATGKYYKSECRSCVDLLAIYEGANILDKESDDEETDKKKKPKKENRPNPSQQKITIRAVAKPVKDASGTLTGIKLLEPNCPVEDRLLKEVDEVVSFQRWLDLRDKARKDLLWLGRLLGYGLFHSVHQYVCDQFVQKNFDGAYFPDYNIDDFHDGIGKQVRFTNDEQTPCREMVLLESRGAYKSTIDGIDAIQWLINCPDIRILIITGVKPLAKKFAKQIKRSFYLAAKAEPTAFQLLFPEYIVTGINGRSESPLECPAARLATFYKEANLWVSSIESANTGDHCDIRKADDVVTSKNSDTKDLREQLKFEFDGTDDLLDQWGFSDVIGTRYFTDDWYGTRLLPNEETKEVAPLRYSCRGCWALKPEDQVEYAGGRLTVAQILKEQRAILTFPQKLSWGKLRDIYNKKGERSFKNQQLNEATDASLDEAYINLFSLEKLRAHSYDKAGAPKAGDVFQSWDTAWSDTSTSDYSVGVTALIYQKPDGEYAACILEIIYGKWKSSELTKNIVIFYEKWHPKRVLIEKVNAFDYMDRDIKRQAILMNSNIHDSNAIYWRPVDVQPKAKRNRIKALELLLEADRLYFCNGQWIDETYKQLINYTGEHSTSVRKDDIPDALAQILFFFPKGKGVVIDGSIEEDPTIARQKAMMKAMHQQMFQEAGPQPLTHSEWQRRQRGGSGVISAEQPEPQRDPRRAMMDKLFGGNGLHS